MRYRLANGVQTHTKGKQNRATLSRLLQPCLQSTRIFKRTAFYLQFRAKLNNRWSTLDIVDNIVYLEDDFFPLCHSGVFKERVDRRCHWGNGSGILDPSSPYPKIPGWGMLARHLHSASQAKSRWEGFARRSMSCFGKEPVVWRVINWGRDFAFYLLMQRRKYLQFSRCFKYS